MPKTPKSPSEVDSGRRRFLTGLAAATGGAALPGCGGGGREPGLDTGSDTTGTLPAPEDSGIDHIILVMMENRSYDHFLGWVPNSDGIQDGLKFVDRNGELQSTYDLGAQGDFQGCNLGDPSHSYTSGRTQLNNGAMDGWLLTDPTFPPDVFPIGYYSEADLPFFSGAAQHFTICDRYYSGILASTFPNRVYMHAGQTDRLNNTLPYAQQAPSTLPTIWDRALDKGVDARYYFYDLPITGLWGEKYADISQEFTQFLADAAIGNLPSIGFIDPFFGASLGESPAGVSRDDHPQADIRDGQDFLNQIYDALRNGPAWDRTLLIINYDEWGGFFDHVVPPVLPVSDDEAALGNDGRLGFRVPLVLLGPRVRRNHVSHQMLHPQSILDMMAWRFGLDPISVRAGLTPQLAHVLDFDSEPNLEAPSFNVPAGPFGTPCADGIASDSGIPLAYTGDPVVDARIEHKREQLEVLKNIRSFGFPI